MNRIEYSDIMNKIKGKGYWRINFQPFVYRENILSASECKDLIERNSIRLRGWRYPYIPTNIKYSGVIDCGNFSEAWIDSGIHKEFWRFYLSGQFIHYYGLWEDWKIEDPLAPSDSEEGTLGIKNATFLITEIFEFLSRLTNSEIYNEGILVKISLKNTKDRILKIDDPNKGSFSYERKTSHSEIDFQENFSKKDIVQAPRELARRVLVYFFTQFGWDNPLGLEKYQEELLKEL